MTTSTATPTARIPACTPFELPSGGAIVYNSSYTSTLTAKLTFQQPCDDPTNPSSSNPGASGNSTVIGIREPFYASTSPQIFAIATATVISYLLVIIIFITPRTFLTGGPRGASSTGFLGRSANASVVGVGRRPWLQKIATVTVAISLTIATADTFRVAQEQYNLGYTDAGLLVDDVVRSLEIRIVRLISDTFLWLAQVQTLIRLFPRHKEKVTIKWLGFALVSLDTIFSILDDFVNQSVRTRPRSFQDAIPALAYLFELAISLIYASCVIYYSLSKRRFAFWHNRMRNICLVALLSLIAVLIPVVFFVLDVSKPDVAGWGDYIRWVGAAAASVVVWEWVERIEALERDERKDGILGREIFDGDEMLDDPTAVETDFPGRRQYWNRHGFPTDDPGQAGGGVGKMRMRALRSRIPFGNRLRGGDARATADGDPNNSTSVVGSDSAAPVALPGQAASPVSRSDTASAGSTIYAIRYHTVNTPAVHDPGEITDYEPQPDGVNPIQAISNPCSSETAAEAAAETAEKDAPPIVPENLTARKRIERNEARSLPDWRTVPNPFKRRRASPPAEVAAQIAESSARRGPAERSVPLRERFTSARRTGVGRDGSRGGVDTAAMAVTVIPAQRRGHRTWSPNQDGDQEPTADQEEQDRNDLEQQWQMSNISTPPPVTIPPSQDYEMPVLVIPAPRRGQRTWSPEDASTGPVLRSPISSPAPMDPPPDEISTRSPVFSMRGTLTISEDQARSQALRSSYARSSPAYVREHGGSPSSRVTPPIAATSPHLDKMVEQHKRSSGSHSGDQSVSDVPAPSGPANRPDNRIEDDVSGSRRR